MGRGEYIGQMIDAALEIRVRSARSAKTKRTFEIVNKSDLRFAVRPASYDYPMPAHVGQVLRIDIRQGEQVEFTNRYPRQGQVLHPHILGIGRRAYAAGAQRCDGRGNRYGIFVTEAIFKPRMQ